MTDAVITDEEAEMCVLAVNDIKYVNIHFKYIFFHTVDIRGDAQAAE